MTAKIMPWGNSQGLRIPKVILDMAKIGENAEVELVPQEHEIVIKLSATKPQTLEDVLSAWVGEYSVGDELKEWEHMPATGKELM
ncbi:hypothetical protein FACS1894111_10730 [Clostridia bacterium]|nr:hypothetical protein FACS1894111_10730 [Clostridia bacterium]